MGRMKNKIVPINYFVICSNSYLVSLILGHCCSRVDCFETVEYLATDLIYV